MISFDTKSQVAELLIIESKISESIFCRIRSVFYKFNTLPLTSKYVYLLQVRIDKNI